MKTDWNKLKNKIPPKIRVGKRIYEILWSIELDGGKTVGLTRFEPAQIVISKKLTPKQAVSCFYHEYLHALSYEYDVNLTENQVLALEKSFLNMNNLILELNS